MARATYPMNGLIGCFNDSPRKQLNVNGKRLDVSLF